MSADQARVRAVVTTGRNADPADEARARALAAEEGLRFVERKGASLGDVRARAVDLGVRADAVLVFSRTGLRLHLDTGEFTYHPGMGVNRIRQLRIGRPDWMIEAMRLSPGQSVLDCTLGLGSDLLVASFVVGERGRAVGLESEPLLALMVREGSKSYVHTVDAVTLALRRMEIERTHHLPFLRESGSASFDVVYFDPMFEDPVEESRHMIPIRLLANPEPVTREVLDEASRVARRRVVVKDRQNGPYVRSGWFSRVVGGPKSRIAYGVLVVQE